jgi:hypothetical protein
MGVPGSANLLLLGGEQGYKISRSLRFNSADSAYLNRTPASAGSRRIATWSGWIKLGNHTSTGEYYLLCTNGSSDSTFFYIQIRNNQLRFGQFNSGTFALYSTQLFRDPSAWYHIVVAVDTTQATASNRAKAYVNGTEITSWSTANYPAQNNDLGINDTRAHAIGAGYASGSPYAYWDGSVTETYLIDGQALTPSSFGETDTITGVWKPKKYAGTYGTNGFYLNFSDNSGTTSTTLGKDSSGNSNNWTPNNFSVTAGSGNDSLIDTPTPYADGGNGRGNYCTLNPLISNALGYLIPAINGNLEVSVTAGSNAFFGQAGTQAITSGKFYWEVTPTAISTSAGTWMEVGIIQSALAYPSSTAIGAFNGGFAYTNDGLKGRSATYSAYGATWTTNDVIGVALDATGGSITFYKNGVSQGAAYTDLANYNLAAGYYPAIAIYRNTGITQSAVFNFGQRSFAYTPPSGFVALNTQNLPEPSIKKPSAYMDTVLYTGTGVARSITGLGFSPDFVWTKVRSSANDHKLYDAVRGATKVLESSNTGAEGTDTQGLTAFNSDGFSLGTASSSNANGSTYVAWCWDESATPGFDIVTYTNTASSASFNHSLGVTPDFIILKGRGPTAANWSVFHKSLSNMTSAFLNLNNTNAANTLGTAVPAPTSTTFGSSSAAIPSSESSVAYLWSEVAGFSKFGSYTGNGSSDGPYVHCGFRPKAVWLKKATGTTNANSGWCIFDSTRSTYNTTSANLRADLSDAESTFSALDFTSTGFKLRVVSIEVNGATSGDTYIFCAWAETPFKYALAR